MTKARMVITLSLTATVVAVLFPPYKIWLESGFWPKSYHPVFGIIFAPPYSDRNGPVIDWQTLALEFVVIAIVTCIGLLITYKK